jgi:hypothetical protein
MATEILPVDFTDHCAMVISVTMESVNRWRGIRHCRINPLKLKGRRSYTPDWAIVGNTGKNPKTFIQIHSCGGNDV